MMTTQSAEMTGASQEKGLSRELAEAKRGAADAVPHPAVIADEPHPGVPPALPVPAALPLPDSSRIQHEQQVRRNKGRKRCALTLSAAGKTRINRKSNKMTSSGGTRIHELCTTDLLDSIMLLTH